MSRSPLRIINSRAPIRVADNGGWTDTWFARRGRVFSIAVSPLAEVQLRVYSHDGSPERITIHAENYGDRYTIAEPNGFYNKHPLLEAALDLMSIPKDIAIDVSIYCAAPAGCSTGTSASVSVALLAALDQLTPGRMSPQETAMAAQRVETELLGQQCGIQDQLAAALGGVNLIEMDEYPCARVRTLPAPDQQWWELESRLVLVYLGRSHNSSEVHRMVIAGLEAEGESSPCLEPLRRCAVESAEAWLRGDFRALGRLLSENTEAQRALHPHLVGPSHQQVIDRARHFDAWGWKVNGAGGLGGSVAILAPPDGAVRRAMEEAILAADPAFRILPIRPARLGLRVWETPPA